MDAFDFSRSRSAFLAEQRLAFGLPRRVTRPRHEHDERMEAHYLEHARNLGRPGYREAPGFTRDRWQLQPDDAPGMAWPRTSSAGREMPYGPTSRAHWRAIARAMRFAFLAEWHRARGSTYETTSGGRNAFVQITGLVS